MRQNFKTSVKLLAFVLSLLMLIVSLPMYAYASLIEEQATEAIESTEAQGEVFVLEEEESLREENIKHFKLSDGTSRAVIYPQAVHYKDADGNWVDINNALALNGSEYSASNKFEIKFANKSGSSGLVSIKDGDYKIDFTPLDTNKSSVVIENPQGSNSRKFDDVKKLSKLTSKATYENIYDGVDIEYILASNNIKENIIVNELLSSYSFSFELKLNKLTAELVNGEIILSNSDSGDAIYKLPAPYMYDASGEYSTDVEYTLTQSNKWKYTLTVTASAEWISSATLPVTIDPTVGVVDSMLVDYSTSPYEDVTVPENELWVGDDYQSYVEFLTLPSLPDSAYITEATVSLKYLSGASDSSENYIGVYDIDASYPTDYIKANSNSDGTYGTDGWYSWSIIELLQAWYSGEKTSYELCFKDVDGGSVIHFAAEEYGEGARPLLSISYRDMKGAEAYWSYISQSAGNAGNSSINLATGNLLFEIGTLTTTENIFGYTPTMIYNSALAGKAYTYSNAVAGYWFPYSANGFKSNMTETIIKDTFVNSAGNDEVYYIWADADGTEHYFIKSNIEGEENIYYDEDGLQLTLEVGLLDDNDYEYLKITDSAHNERIFTYLTGVPTSSGLDGVWYISQIKDKNGNSIVFNFDGAHRPNDIYFRPSGTTQNTVMLSPLYNSDGMLTLIWCNATREGVLFRHSDTPNGDLDATGGKYLREALYVKCDSTKSWPDLINFIGETDNVADGITVNAVMKYEYNSNGYLTSVHDTLSDYKIEYGYNYAGQVTSVTEKGKNDTQGQAIGINYGVGYTEVRTSGSNDIYGDSDDIINVYVFDNQGRAITIYSTNVARTEIYGATSGEYVSDNEKAKNNIKTSNVIGSIGSNYLLNGNFEIDELQYNDAGNKALSYWNITDNVYFNLSSAKSEWDNGNVWIYSVANQTTGISQTVSLKKGSYTFSLDISAVDSDDSTIYLRAVSENHVFEEQLPVNEQLASGSITFATLSFDVTEEIADYTIGVYVIGDSNASGSVTIDNLMLSNTSGSSAYNYVNSGNFDNYLLLKDSVGGWSCEQSSSYLVTEENERFENSLKLGSEIDEKSEVYQTIYHASVDISEDDNDGNAINPSNIVGLLGATGETKIFMLSGFGKAPEAMSSDNSTFAIRLDVTYCKTGEAFETVSTYANFDPSNDGWQFASATFILPSDSIVEDITVVCEYSNNVGSAYFDNISLICENDSPTTQYYYYAEGVNAGKLMAEVNGISHVTYYMYDECGNVTNIITERDRTAYTYYEGTDNVKTSAYYKHNVFPAFLEETLSFLTEIEDKQIIKYVSNYSYDQYGLLTEEITYDAENSKYIKNSYVYETTVSSKIFGALKQATDSLGKNTRYSYDNDSGRLLYVFEPDNEGYYYTYDDIGNLVMVQPTKYSSSVNNGQNTAEVQYVYNSSNQLEKIIANDTVYTFTYDVFGNQSSVKIGDSQIVSQQTSSYNGKVTKTEYADGTVVEYEYDKLSRVIKVTYTNGDDSVAYDYEYDSNGNLSKFVDGANNTTTIYKYDNSGRLLKMVEYDNDKLLNTFGASYAYDDESRISSIYYTQDYLYESTLYDGLANSYAFSYNDDTDKSLKSIMITVENAIEYILSYNYDSFSRYSTKEIAFGDITNFIDYKYLTSDNATSSLVSEYVTSVITENGSLGCDTFRYTYDSANQNITEIRNGNGELLYRYTYDGLDRLTTAECVQLNITFEYIYDDNGNILFENLYSYTDGDLIKSNEYEYDNSAWADQLTSYNGITITYDKMGNPLFYYNGDEYRFTWSNVNNLSSIKLGNDEMYYTYNDEGIRTSKIVDGVLHTYMLEGSKIISEAYGNVYLLYIYDESDLPIGFMYRESSDGKGEFDKYLFTKNLQGDIIGIYDENGTQVASYSYDAWGGHDVISYTDDNIGFINPFRYRGYYFDQEAGFYYLNSRYYDPTMHRFINADSVSFLGANGNLTAFNLYAYCSNNPVMFVDHNGEYIISAILIGVIAGIIIGGTVGGVVSYNSAKSSGVEDSKLFLETLKGVGKGALLGGTVGALIGATGGVVAAYGVGSLAGTTMITGTTTILARSIEVGILQSKKSQSEEKNNWQVAGDCLNSLFYNGHKIIGLTPFTKTAGIAFNFSLDLIIAKDFGCSTNLNSFLKSAGGKIVPYAFAILAITNTVISALTQDPVSRADERGYVLQ